MRRQLRLVTSIGRANAIACGSQLYVPSIVSVRFAYAASSKRYPTAHTPLGPLAAAPVTNGFDDAGVVSRVQDVPFQRRTSGAPLERPRPRWTTTARPRR
jgi:hypothetical protein